MHVSPLRALALAAAAALAGCASQTPETRATRFHLGQPIAPAAVAIEPLDPKAKGSLEFDAYSGAVAGQLTRLGFRMAPGVPNSELVAVIDVQRGTRETMAQRSPVTVGIGGGSFGWGGGVGGGVSFPVGKGRSNAIAATELAVQLKRRSEGTVIWEGRALTEAPAGSPAADPASTAARLADALFRDFPGESGRTISVK